MSDFVFELLAQALLAAAAAVGFGLSFAVPAPVLVFCAAGGALGRGLRFALGPAGAGMPLEWATLVAAATVSLLAIWGAQRLRAHPKAFTVAAMIPMIPGVQLFTALIAVAQMQRQGVSPELLASAIEAGLASAHVIAALAVGLAVPGLLFYRRRPLI